MSPNENRKIGAALVVGGGIAGVQAALDLANFRNQSLSLRALPSDWWENGSTR